AAVGEAPVVGFAGVGREAAALDPVDDHLEHVEEPLALLGTDRPTEPAGGPEALDEPVVRLDQVAAVLRPRRLAVDDELEVAPPRRDVVGQTLVALLLAALVVEADAPT